MKLHKNFTGGNIRIVKQDGDTFFLDNEQRDTQGNWFYWAFCMEGAQGKTLTFRFPDTRLGYFGPAVSRDLENWEWLGAGNDRNSFAFTFSESDSKIYFAHSMLYHPDRFRRFAENNALEMKTLCISRKGREVPYVTFGNGKRKILLTARHHACESSGNYVLEGVLECLLRAPLPDTQVICVPFVDFDGVTEGDQGKDRYPHDHNRDYVPGKASVYPEIRAIRAIAENGVEYGFDFHSPWHCGKENDTVFIVQKRVSKLEEYRRFASLFESSVNENALQYERKNDYPCDTGWNRSDTTCFGCYMLDQAKAKIAFTLETTYFGNKNNVFSQDKALETGRCFAKALKRFDTNATKISFTGDLMCSREMLQNTKGNFTPMFEKIKSALLDTDYLAGNCESPVAGEEFGYTNEMYCFNTPVSFLETLKESGFRLLALANNHILDRGEEGILRTLANCQKYGFDTVGAYASSKARNTVFVKEIGDLKIAFLNYTYGVNAFVQNTSLKHKYMVNLYQPEETQPGAVDLLASPEKIERAVDLLYKKKNKIFDDEIAPYLNQLKQDIGKAKAQADLVVMISHCGGQYNDEPDAYTKYLRRYMRDCGVDVIVGHHPHIIQKCDISDGWLTAYSIGNFTCDFLNNTSKELAESVIDPSYSILLNLYLVKNAESIQMTAGFKILKTTMENSIAVTRDAYELFQETKDASLKKDILFFANRFVNSRTSPVCTVLQREYFIDPLLIKKRG